MEEATGGLANLPASLARRSDLDAIREDIQPYTGTSPEERDQILQSLCRFAAEQISKRPDGRRILAYQEPRSAQSVALWMRLIGEERSR